MKKISVTFLKYKKSDKETIKEIEKTDVDYIHVDVMDGKFVPNLVIPLEKTHELLGDTTKPLDVHLMVEHPYEYILEYAKLKTDIISIHIELEEDIDYLIDLIHSYGIKAGLAINSDTPLQDLYPYLSKIDYIIIMAIIPGFGGQKMITEMTKRIPILKQLREDNNYHYMIGLDGGINKETRELLDDLDVVISGSYIVLSDNLQEKIDSLR